MEQQRVSGHDVSPQQTESLGELLGDILKDGQRLVEQELLLFRTELQQEWTKARAAAWMLGIGGVVAAAAGLAVVMFLVFALEALTGLPLWACFGSCAVAFAAGATLLVLKGRELAQKVDFVPRETVDSVKENVRWFRKRI